MRKAASLALILASLLAGELSAVDYSGDLRRTDRWWSASGFWSPEGMPSSASDRILNLTNTHLPEESARTSYLWVDGDYTIGTFHIATADGLRLQNRGDSYTLTVADTFHIASGGVFIRSREATETVFSLAINHLELGSFDGGGQAVRGTLSFTGLTGTGVNYSRIDFTVAGTTTITGNSLIGFEGTSQATEDTSINLGHLVFSDNSGTSYLNLGSSATLEPHTVTAKSLRSEAASAASVSIRGQAILELSGNQDDPGQPAGENRFYGLLQDGVRLEKTGSNLQVLAREGGNTYSGGTTVSGGGLVVANLTGSALGSGDVTVSGSGVLGGSGRIALAEGEQLTVEAGGVIAPGLEGEPVTLRLAGNGSDPTLVMEAGGAFRFRLGSGGESDRIAFLNYTSSGLLLDEGGIAVELEGSVTSGLYELFTFQQGDEASQRIASGLTGGLALATALDGYVATFHYDEALYGGPGVIALEIAAIPEPGTLGLLVLGVSVGGIFLLRGRKG